MGDLDADVPLLFTQEPSQHLKCPVCQQLYNEPVINIVCGHTFCKTCAQSTSKCPTDGSACDPKLVVINRLVIGQIEDLLIFCRHGLVKENGAYIPDPSGCQEKIHLGSRTDHESECDFKWVFCPNKNCHAKLRQSELLNHQKICVHNSCQYTVKGCEYQGGREEVEEHETTCGYRGLQTSTGTGDLQTVAVRTREIEDVNQQLQIQVATLHTRVEDLESVNSSLHGQLQDCIETIQDMQQKMETLSSTVEQLMTIRNRRSIGSPAHVADGRPRSASSSFRRSFSGSPPSTARHQRWAMPFQFKCIGTLRGHQDVVWCMAAKNHKLYTAGSDCLVKVWDLENLQRGCIRTIQGHTSSIQSMTLSGKYLYTGGHDNSLCCWNIEDYSLVNRIQNAHDNIISAMVVVGDYVFTSSFSLIKIWEVETLNFKSTLTGLHHWVRALALNPERDKLFSGSHNTIDIWSVTEPFGLKGKVDHTFGSVHSLAITSKYIIAGTYNRNLHIFRLSTFEHVTPLQGHIGIVTSVVASPCEGFCMSSSSDQTIKVTTWTYNHNVQIFDYPSLEYRQQLSMHMGSILSLATSRCGQFLFSASVDHSIQIWNLENMLPTQSLQRHEGSVNTLVLYNDFLFSGSEDKEIKVFMYFQMQMGFALNS